jgi:hypothetical protein
MMAELEAIELRYQSRLRTAEARHRLGLRQAQSVFDDSMLLMRNSMRVSTIRIHAGLFVFSFRLLFLWL